MGLVRWSLIIPIDEGFIIERGSYKMGNFMAPKKLSISDIHQFAMWVLSLLSHHWSEHLQTDHLPLLLLTLFSKVDVVTNFFMNVRDFHPTTCPEFMWHHVVTMYWWLLAPWGPTRGVYFGKSDCLILPKMRSFYGKPAKTVMSLD